MNNNLTININNLFFFFFFLFVLNCSDAPGEIKVHLALHDGRHDKFGIKDSNFGLQDVRDNVQVMLAGDYEVNWIIVRFINFPDLFHIFPATILNFTSGGLYHKFEFSPRWHNTGCQIEDSSLKINKFSDFKKINFFGAFKF
jgi:hypothetical protein